MLNPIVYAAPVFIALILIELALGWRRQANTYRITDTVSSIGLGVLSQVVGLFTKLFLVGIYTLVWQHAALFELPQNAWWVWALALLAYDFCYYWLHRMGHEINILWAAHVVHHSSEEYNLSTALRQTSTGFLLSWLFYLPMAVVGFPPLVFVVVGLINLLYQYWIHTRQIGHLGWFDKVFASPSNHRVHHGQNDYCLDRNYGGMLMLWDHLFGSFVDEREGEDIVYGIRGQLKSWNPLRANLHVYAELWRDCRLADNWADKLKVWIMHPGWRPAAAIAKAPKPAYDIGQFHKYDPPLAKGLATYGLAQFAGLFVLGVHFLAIEPSLSLAASAGYALLLAGSLWVLGGLLEGQRHFITLESLRLLLLAGAIGLSQHWLSPSAIPSSAQYLALSLLAASLYALLRIPRQPERTGTAAA
ncbi:sterol desaturase family protein [Chitinimonas taiwanensis]|uniref:Sterol desaturase/sphingolipid hydroxylase, fatty acid hydroxylase superfamily n=1 Tax=Chitinimonas taiwanensis DSM 18899 TaxID=1121279 RepID=A0A1K2HD26_9NEIS|nr:sterol desaturase family protein [Chitinimonas taiwanensis]SFZ74728.1 Sterol desaturase/sphingolipid hydroxylase, fatty acid hydroxylase superfamily [Chitinimonas taiwanensis DSM 18899]